MEQVREVGLGQQVLRFIESRGDDLAEAARKSGVAYATLHDLTSGKTESPRTSTLQRLARAYNVPVSRFIEIISMPEGAAERAAQAVRETSRSIYGLQSDEERRRLAELNASLALAAGGEGPASVPGFSILLPRPREAFEAWYRELRGWASELHLPDDEVEQLAAQTIGPLARFGTRYQEGQHVDVRSEEAQMKVLDGMKELIREDLKTRRR